MVTSTYDIVRTGVNQPNRGGFLYPFVVKGSPLLDSIVDLRVGFDPAVHVAPLKLHTCTNMVSGSKRLVIRDANNVVVVDTVSLIPPTTTTWGDRYTVIRWRTAKYGLAIVFDTELMTDADPVTGGDHEIDIRACEPAFDMVRRVTVYNASNTVLADMQAFSKIKWVNGYNAKVISSPPKTPSFSGDKLSANIRLSMAPGDGLGQYDNCADLDSGLIGKIGGVGPDASGNVAVSADRCLRIEPVVSLIGDEAIIEPGIVMVGDDCKACCDCEDYANVYSAMNRTQRTMNNAALRSQTLSDVYENSRQFIHDKIACTLDNTVLRIIGSAVAKNDYGVGAGVANPTQKPINNVVIRISLSQVNSNGTATHVDSSTQSVYASLLRNNVAESYGDVVVNNGNLEITLGRIPAGETVTAIARAEATIQTMAQICVEVVSWEPEDVTLAMPMKICTLVRSCGV